MKDTHFDARHQVLEETEAKLKSLGATKVFITCDWQDPEGKQLKSLFGDHDDRKPKRDKVTAVRLDPELRLRLKQRAKELNVTTSELLRTYVAVGLDLVWPLEGGSDAVLRELNGNVIYIYSGGFQTHED